MTVFLIVAGMCTFQHLMYASLFYSPFAASLCRRYHTQFIYFSYALKLESIAYALISILDKYGWPAITTRTYWGLALFAFGAHLNYKVHLLLGSQRIYYGFELGVSKREWITAYPYSVFRDPQYTGAVYQIIGACLVFGHNADKSMRWDIHLLTAYTSLLYYFTIQVEKRCIYTENSFSFAMTMRPMDFTTKKVSQQMVMEEAENETTRVSKKD